MLYSNKHITWVRNRFSRLKQANKDAVMLARLEVHLSEAEKMKTLLEELAQVTSIEELPQFIERHHRKMLDSVMDNSMELSAIKERINYE